MKPSLHIQYRKGNSEFDQFVLRNKFDVDGVYFVTIAIEVVKQIRGRTWV